VEREHWNKLTGKNFWSQLGESGRQIWIFAHFLSPFIHPLNSWHFHFSIVKRSGRKEVINLPMFITFLSIQRNYIQKNLFCQIPFHQNIKKEFIFKFIYFIIFGH
jgi:hypothetical protein